MKYTMYWVRKYIFWTVVIHYYNITTICSSRKYFNLREKVAIILRLYYFISSAYGDKKSRTLVCIKTTERTRISLVLRSVGV